MFLKVKFIFFEENSSATVTNGWFLHKIVDF